MTTHAIEIVVGDVSDMEARVVARYNATSVERNAEDLDPDQIVLSGAVRGPYCTNARTLPANFAFRDVKRDRAASTLLAEAVIADPCMWSPELPHVYHVDVEARQGEQVVAEYHGQIGLKRTTPRRAYDFSSE